MGREVREEKGREVRKVGKERKREGREAEEERSGVREKAWRRRAVGEAREGACGGRRRGEGGG